MKKLDRLFFRESQNRRRERCFIGKVKENGLDVIVIANSGIDKVGKWDVEVEPIQKGTGYVVTSAKFSQDTLSLLKDDDEVVVLVNGTENKLKRRVDGKEKYIRLVWRSGGKVNYNTLLRNLEEKVTFLQLPPDFSMENFLQELKAACEEVDERYSARRFRNYVPNTPFADFFKDRK